MIGPRLAVAQNGSRALRLGSSLSESTGRAPFGRHRAEVSPQGSRSRYSFLEPQRYGDPPRIIHASHIEDSVSLTTLLHLLESLLQLCS
jgi:hypothetical protein